MHYSSIIRDIINPNNIFICYLYNGNQNILSPCGIKVDNQLSKKHLNDSSLLINRYLSCFKQTTHKCHYRLLAAAIAAQFGDVTLGYKYVVFHTRCKVEG